MAKNRFWRLLAVLLTITMLATACGGDDSTVETSAGDSPSDTTADEPEEEETLSGIGTTAEDSEPEPEEEAMEEEAMEEEAMEEEAMEEEAEGEEVDEEAMADNDGPSGTLRYVEFSPINNFDPDRSQTAQSVYLYPIYDTLTRQKADFSLEPSLATAWSSPEPGVWVFEIRDDVTFHDGSELDGQVVADNMNRSKSVEGNPNSAVWAGFEEATATGDFEVTATFSVPQPQFPLEMSMVPGMMVSPKAMADETDMTRNPQGSGPWIWQDGESEAGVTEVFTVNPDYWDPSVQGVERIEATAVPDNTARMNAILTGATDIMSTVRDAQKEDVSSAGNELLSVPNFFPYMGITGRADGSVDGDLLQLDLVRQAVAYAIDRTAYNDAVHAGQGDDKGGIYPSAFADWHVAALDDSFAYDPEKSKELLAEAGFPDGITLKSPIMPAIQPPVELVTQMLGAVGITVDQTQINNGELGGRVRAGEWGIWWGRELLYHPAATFGKYTAEEGSWNPDKLTDLKDVDDLVQQAAAAPDLATQQELYAEVGSELINRNVIVPLAHGSQTGAYAPTVIGTPVLGLNMQAPLPYGLRVEG